MAKSAKAGFQLNYKQVAKILKSDASASAVRAGAEQILANVIDDDSAHIDEYTTDRRVAGVVVRADKQAKHGTGTRAANASGLTPGR
ncbi:hypothetical protein EB72_24790 [Mycobacterium sp. SWH-M1]|nr:hypothetical protein EB72_24790 [Mycobacterium sp. SWH-M1]